MNHVTWDGKCRSCGAVIGSTVGGCPNEGCPTRATTMFAGWGRGHAALVTDHELDQMRRSLSIAEEENKWNFIRPVAVHRSSYCIQCSEKGGRIDMHTIKHDSSTDLRPCAKCPNIWERMFLSPLCAKDIFCDPVTGNPYQACRYVRSLSGGLTSDGGHLQCLGYDAETNAVISSRVRNP